MQAKQKTDKKQIRREIEYQGVGESGRPKDLRITNETRWVIHRVLVDVEWCNVTNSTYVDRRLPDTGPRWTFGQAFSRFVLFGGNADFDVDLRRTAPRIVEFVGNNFIDLGIPRMRSN